MPKNSFSIIDWMTADLIYHASRITHHILRFTFCTSRIRPLLIALAFTFTAASLFADDKITYQDHILPLVEANCSKCHNADKKKADLDLTSYQGALKGSGSGPVVLSGNVDGSKLWKALAHSEEPYMPSTFPELDDKDLELIKKMDCGRPARKCRWKSGR